MDVLNGITNPEELREALRLALSTKDNWEYIMVMHKYKWYNWYQNIHIKEGTDADKENTKIFEEIETQHPEIHKLIEDNIDIEIDKLNNPSKYYL